ncbi:MAG: hypothetical protein CMC21_00230 [Flavobacteriaceae bacterium]|nr:hypothetical protein [Flavobacteriaceae bacterium]|tara:strand:+ start:4746 stop:5291 length:546 start_codon:yes stop_codon:yes gene_type:complete
MRFFLIKILIFNSFFLIGQDYDDDYDFFEPINDSSVDGQRLFVEELLDLAGYVPEKISVYQTLPNKAHVFRVKLDSVYGGFIFVRWDKIKKENYIANKLIDPGIYFNLKSAKEIMRRQTNKASFSTNDVSIQASDQEIISNDDLIGHRQDFELKEREKALEKAKKLLKKNSKKKLKKKDSN